MLPDEAGVYPAFDLPEVIQHAEDQRNGAAGLAKALDGRINTAILHVELRVALSPFSPERLQRVMPLLMHLTERLVYSDPPAPPKLSMLEPSIRALVKRLRVHVKASWRVHSDTYTALIRDALDANR